MTAALCACLVSVSCGGAKPGVAKRYRVGDVYDTRQVCAARGLSTIRSDTRSTMTVTAANSDGSATVRIVTTDSAVWLIRPDIELPPLRVHDRRVADYRLDQRGRVVDATPVEPAEWLQPNTGRPWEPQIGLLPDLSDVLPLPAGAMRVGGEWTARSGFEGPFVGTATGQLTHSVRSIDAAHMATITSSGTLRWPASESGGTLVVRPDSERRLSLDSLVGTTRLRMGIEGRADALGVFESIVCDACVARTGSACRVDEADATVSLSLARAVDYTGGACAPRVARMRNYLQALRASEGRGYYYNSERLVVVPGVVDALPVNSPIVDVSAGGLLTLDQRAVDDAQLLIDLDTLDRNWGILHPGTSSPRRVSAPLTAAAPAARAASALSAVRATGRAVFVHVTNGQAAPPVPSAPLWVVRLLSAGPAGADNPNFQTVNAIAAGVCFGVTRLYAQVAAADAAAKFEVMLDGLPAAVAECGCGGLDVDAIEHIVGTIGGTGPLVRAFEWDGRMPEPGESVASWILRIALREMRPSSPRD